MRYCRSLCSGKTDAEAADVLQQSFLQALENYDSLSDENKFKSWFFKIITNCYLDAYRKRFWKRFLSLEKIESNAEIPSVFDTVKVNDDRILLSNALAMISDKERAALLLFEIAGFSIEEIAQIQNENSISAVKSRLSRSRQKLKDIILSTEDASNGKKNYKKSGTVQDIETETLNIITEINSEKNGR